MSFSRRKVRTGRVVSDKMDKTVVVLIEWRRPHPLYKKPIRRSSRFRVHDPNNEGLVGDLVRVIESRPISKTKRWRLVEVLEREEIVDIQPEDIGVDPSVAVAGPSDEVESAEVDTEEPAGVLTAEEAEAPVAEVEEPEVVEDEAPAAEVEEPEVAEEEAPAAEAEEPEVVEEEAPVAEVEEPEAEAPVAEVEEPEAVVDEAPAAEVEEPEVAEEETPAAEAEELEAAEEEAEAPVAEVEEQEEAEDEAPAAEAEEPEAAEEEAEARGGDGDEPEPELGAHGGTGKKDEE